MTINALRRGLLAVAAFGLAARRSRILVTRGAPAAR
jgi:hypothetical protein